MGPLGTLKKRLERDVLGRSDAEVPEPSNTLIADTPDTPLLLPTREKVLPQKRKPKRQRPGLLLPRFFKRINKNAAYSSRNCTLQIPAPFIRKHISESIDLRSSCKASNFRFELTTSCGVCKCGVQFDGVKFKRGWKQFAEVYELKEGDGVMFSLVARGTLQATVFSQSGMEMDLHTECE